MASLLYQMLDPVATDQRAKADQDALIARFGGREAALGKGPAGASPVPPRQPSV
jgi:choline-sulfatase